MGRTEVRAEAGLPTPTSAEMEKGQRVFEMRALRDRLKQNRGLSRMLHDRWAWPFQCLLRKCGRNLSYYEVRDPSVQIVTALVYTASDTAIYIF